MDDHLLRSFNAPLMFVVPTLGLHGNGYLSLARLEGKVAIVTGGASGIGASAVRIFKENGAKVVIADIQDQFGQQLADNLGGDDVCYIHCDVSDEDDVANAVDTTVAKFGQLDVMYNNAGILEHNRRIKLIDTPKSDMDRLMAVNLIGAFLGAKHAARVMIPQGKGCILFTASASTAIAGISSNAYAASKAAAVGLAKNLTVELGQSGIPVNCVSPYGVLTSIAGGIGGEEQRAIAAEYLSRMANLKGETLTKDDVARAALFLGSDDAKYVSGLNLLVDGGFSVVNPSFLREPF